MEKQIVGTKTIYKKKHPVRTKKMPFKEKKYYEPLYGTPECTYEGNKNCVNILHQLLKPLTGTSVI